MRMLIAAGAAVNVLDTAGLSPLMHAASHGSVKAAELLINAGANVHLETSARRKNALLYAAAGGSEPMVELLLAMWTNTVGAEAGWVGRALLRVGNVEDVVPGASASTATSNTSTGAVRARPRVPR